MDKTWQFIQSWLENILMALPQLISNYLPDSLSGYSFASLAGLSTATLVVVLLLAVFAGRFLKIIINIVVVAALFELSRRLYSGQPLF